MNPEVPSFVPTQEKSLRRTSRSNAGQPPDRHGDYVTFVRPQDRKKTLVGMTSEQFSEPANLFESNHQQESVIQTANSVKSQTSSASKSSHKSNSSAVSRSSAGMSSYATDVSTVRRRQLRAELQAETELNRIAEEENALKLEMARLEMQNKLDTLQRKRKLTQKNLEIEKQQLFDDDDDSQNLSSEDDYSVDVDEDVERSSQVEDKLNFTHNQPSNYLQFQDLHHSTPRQPDLTQFQMFSRCIADAIVNAGNTRSSEKQDTDMKKFVARQSGSKELPSFSGDAKDWPAFIAAYKRSTSNCQFSNDENLIRLQKCLSGPAKDAVHGLLISPENVPQILRNLEKRFGQSNLIIEQMIQKVSSISPVPESKPEKLLELSSAVENLVAVVESLKKPLHLYNPVLLQSIVSKLPFHLNLRWGEKMAEVEDGQDLTIKDFTVWLSKMAEALILSGIKISPIVNENSDKNQNRHVKKKEIILATAVPTKPKYGCLFCDETSHFIQTCPKFISQGTESRWKFIKEKKACISCLRLGHSIKICKKRKDCGINACKRPHHKLLHEEIAKVETVMISKIEENPRILLKVLPVRLTGPKGCMDSFALLDDGATGTLIDAGIAEILGLEGHQECIRIHGANHMNHIDRQSRIVTLKISGKNLDEEFTLQNVRTMKNLSLPFQTVNAKTLKKKWKHLEEVELHSFIKANPVLLIGQDNAQLTVVREVVESSSQGPIASRTKLGWVVHGNNAMLRGRIDSEVVLCTHTTEADDQLHELIKQHYSLDSFGVKLCAENVKSREIERAELILKTTTRRVGEKFETGLLWKYDDVHLPESKTNAFRKLRHVERKMDADSSFAKQYTEKIEDYVNKGYAKKLTSIEVNNSHSRINYLSHFEVINPNKPGKIRIVMNAAAKNHGKSLNDHLLTGPDLYNSLPGILFKFRQKKIAVGADIKEMFPQIKIRPEDSMAQRFLWRGAERNRDPDVFEMTSMVFGSVSSPASAQYVKNLNASEFSHKYPEACEAIIKRHYMDDHFDSHDSVKVATKIASEIILIHAKGGFCICNWVSNSKEFLSHIPENLRCTNTDAMSLEELPEERVLGMKWRPTKDVFCFVLHFHRVPREVLEKRRCPTKREIASLIPSIFDVFGFLAHYTIQAKILHQEVWRMGGEWDDPIAASIRPGWERWIDDLPKIQNIEVPRCYFPDLKDDTINELHIFSDASQQAKSVVIYARFIQGTNFTVRFVMGRSWVTPLKPVSIPRLELQAALLGSRLATFVQENHSIKFHRVQFWTDSSTVLCWLRSDARKFPTFVANRIGEIEESTNAGQWRWVPTKENPADDATRNNASADLSSSCRWLNGPNFLQQPETEWPKDLQLKKNPPSNEDLELKPEFVLVTNILNEICAPVISRFSNWNRLIRSTAYLLRYFQKCRKLSDAKDELHPDEIANAETFWLKKSQRSSFEVEIRCLQNQKELPKSSKLKILTPFLDANGILRVNSRIKNANLPMSTKFPAILNPQHEYTKLLILWHHRKIGHHGQELLVNELRQHYYIFNIRTAVKGSWNRCQVCKNYRARPHPPLMSELPEMRVTKFTRAFTHVGMDGFGPIEIKRGRCIEKRYGLIFTCLSTRAIHIELLDSLNTDSAILALRRFMSRRGCPSCLYSDNGTNFRGAERELRQAMDELDRKRITAELTIHRTDWKFIPPRSPHMGGAWERLIQSIKIALKSTLKEVHPKEETLRTLLCEAENIINSRPITHVSVDPNDMEALTPNHFLIHTSSSTPTPGEFSDTDLHLRKQWKITQRLADLFWQRWVKEYLPNLHKRQKWNTDSPPVKIGDVVIIADDQFPRNTWPKGIIIQVYPGRDGRIRVVDVKTSTGTFRRPIVKIIVLDVLPKE